MKYDGTDEIINNILQLRLDILELNLKLGQSFKAIRFNRDGRLAPKKVVRKQEEPMGEEAKELVDLGFYGGNVICCPNCNKHIVIDKLKYCIECGQALDWSDFH